MSPPNFRDLQTLVSALQQLEVETSNVDDAIATALAQSDNEAAQLEANARVWLVTAREAHRMLSGELEKVETLLDDVDPKDQDRPALERIQRAFTSQLSGLEALLEFLASGDQDALHRADVALHAGAREVAPNLSGD